MATRDELALKYDQQYKALHEEFYKTINEGTSQQQRVLREGKSASELNLRYAEITQNYEAELVANGFEGLNPPEPPPLTPDELRLQEIISNPVEALTMPEVWEAIRILTRLRGI